MIRENLHRRHQHHSASQTSPRSDDNEQEDKSVQEHDQEESWNAAGSASNIPMFSLSEDRLHQLNPVNHRRTSPPPPPPPIRLSTTSHTQHVANRHDDTELFIPDKNAMTAFTGHIIEKCEIIPKEAKQIVSNVTMKLYDQYGMQATKLVWDELRELQLEQLLGLFNSKPALAAGTQRRSGYVPPITLSTSRSPKIGPSGYSSPLDPPHVRETMLLGEFGEKGTEIKSGVAFDFWDEPAGFDKFLGDLLQMISKITRHLFIRDPSAGPAASDIGKSIGRYPSAGNGAGIDAAGDGFSGSDESELMDGQRFKTRVAYFSMFCFTAYIACSVVMNEVRSRYGGNADQHFADAFKHCATDFTNSAAFG